MAIPVYRYLAQVFRREDVDTVFVLSGDGNMYWEAALSEDPSVRAIHVRHEHCACAMASAYARATGSLGVASVTCGPGLTQIMTALATAAQARIPLLVFAGESSLHESWSNQGIDQVPLVRATGADYVQVHSTSTLPSLVREAFFRARHLSKPVVLGVPIDLQQEFLPAPPEGASSLAALPASGPRQPHPDYVDRAVERIEQASKIVIVAGRGAQAPSAVAACIKLADRCDAALASTMPVRGLFADHPRSIGIMGGYAHPAAKEACRASDLVVVAGASLTTFTTDSSRLIPPEKVVLVDPSPLGLNHTDIVANTHVTADVTLGLEAIIAALDTRGSGDRPPAWDVTSISAAVRQDAPDSTEYPIEPGLLDPRRVIEAFNRLAPVDWSYVNGGGHSGYFPVHMHDRPAGHFLTIREFGAVGNGLSYAAGVAVATPAVPVVLFEGDGGLMMHIQELDTVHRYGLKILICVLNDGAFGSEIHRLRAAGLSDRGPTYGRADFAAVARGFGLRGRTVSDLADIPGLIAEFDSGSTAMVLNFAISDKVMSPGMSRRVEKMKRDRSGELV
jgi:acetolactate synthase I/II/III large subunit